MGRTCRDACLDPKARLRHITGELDPGSVGIAVPIVHASLDNPAVVVLVMTRQRFALVDEARVIKALQDAPERIRRRLDFKSDGR